MAMRPERIAVYSYAHVPWLRPHQKHIDASELPSREVKWELIGTAIESFAGAGYMPIGMDHFALAEDELAVATRERRLHRNFMGYTTRRATDMVGVGLSAIGDVSGAFAQNVKKLRRSSARSTPVNSRLSAATCSRRTMASAGTSSAN